MSQRSSRRNLIAFFVDPLKQIQMGFYVLLITVLFLFMAAVVLSRYFIAQYNLNMNVFNALTSDMQDQSLAVSHFFNGIYMTLGIFGAYVVALFSVIVVLTHRIYGPMVSIERFIESLKRGDYKARIVLRKNDELKNIAKKLNELAETLDR